MTPAEQDSYKRQFEQARRRLPKRHAIHHCTWRNGRLSVLSAPVERPAKEPTPKARPRVTRGIQAALFD